MSINDSNLLVLILKDLRTGNDCAVGRSDSPLVLVSFIEYHRVEPYDDTVDGVTYRKFFKQGSPLEWSAPPGPNVRAHIVELPSRKEAVQRATHAAGEYWDNSVGVVPIVQGLVVRQTH